MTKEKAREIIYKQWQSFLQENIDYAGISEAYKMALKALEVEPCEDARAEIEKEYNRFCDMSDKFAERACGLGRALEIIDELTSEKEELPSVQPILVRLRPQGRWIKTRRENIFGWPVYECSECHTCLAEKSLDDFKYCFGCGLKMAKPQESEDK